MRERDVDFFKRQATVNPACAFRRHIEWMHAAESNNEGGQQINLLLNLLLVATV